MGLTVEDIIIRQMTPEDKDSLSLLYDRVWPENTGRHFDKTSWAIDTSEYPGVCAATDDKIIGSRACFRANIYQGDRSVTSVQFGDSCVDEGYRRLGLFSRMNKFFIDSFFITGNELIYNVSVAASRKAYEKLGWVYIKSMSTIIKVLHPISLLIKTRGRLNRLVGSIEVDRAPIPDVSAIPDSLFAKREALFENTCILHNRYNKDILRWRLGSNSSIKLLNVREVGACLYKTGIKNDLKCCVIGELFLADYSFRCFRKMIKALKALDRFDIMSISITHAHPLYPMYFRKGFFYNPFRPFLNHGVRVNSDAMKEKCMEPNNWVLSTLDLDTF